MHARVVNKIYGKENTKFMLIVSSHYFITPTSRFCYNLTRIYSFRLRYLEMAEEIWKGLLIQIFGKIAHEKHYEVLKGEKKMLAQSENNGSHENREITIYYCVETV